MKRLTIREIYAAMEEKYPYYRTAGPTWKVCSRRVIGRAQTYNSLRVSAIRQTPSVIEQIIRTTAAASD